MTTRTATLDDIPYLSEAYRRLVEHIRTRTNGPYFVQLNEEYTKTLPDWIKKLIEHEKVLVVIGGDSDRPAGFCVGVVRDSSMSISKIRQVGDIIACWVEPDARRKGVARRLVRHAEAWFDSRGIHYVEIDYMVGNPEAENFWRRMGYAPFRISSLKCITKEEKEPFPGLPLL